MARIQALLESVKSNPRNVRFRDLAKLCEHYFGEARQRSGSHMVFKTPWPGDPRVNVQNNRGFAKAYQVKQVLTAIEKLEVGNVTEE